MFEDYYDSYDVIEEYFGINPYAIDTRVNNANKIYDSFFNKILANYLSSKRYATYNNDTQKRNIDFIKECFEKRYESFEE